MFIRFCYIEFTFTNNLCGEKNEESSNDFRFHNDILCGLNAIAT